MKPSSTLRLLVAASLLPGAVPGTSPYARSHTAPLSAQEPAPAATIHRDAWGAPHVFSDTDRGAVFGMAWALAEDDWPLIEQNYLRALGRLAELEGADAVEGDWMARALEIVPLSLAEYAAATPRMRGLLDAFAAGMNGWLARRVPDGVRVLERIEPWYPLALIRFKYYQNEFLGYAGLRSAWSRALFARSAAAAVSGAGPGEPAPDTGTEISDVAYLRSNAPAPFSREAAFDDWGRRPRGSNEWALAPARTASGEAFLLINPHQSFVGVQRYAEIHLDSREGLRFSGLTVFGFLLPYMGHNERLGWAYTDNYADHSDLWAESISGPGDALRYRYGAEERPVETWVDTVRVRTADGLEARAFRYWRTHHGPLVGVDGAGRPLAVRLARMREGGWFDQWDAMIRARTLEDWRAAVAMLRVPYMNTMYADADGNIGYIYNSAVPRRLPGVDPSGILDGTDPRTAWQGFHALEELPQVWNPPSGWLLNTNSTPFTATVDLPFSRADFPAYMVGSETDNARAASSRRLLAGLEGVRFEDFAAHVWDSRLSAAEAGVPELLAEWARVEAGGAGAAALPAEVSRQALADAVARLDAWDRRADTASVATTWFVLASELRAREGALPWLTALGSALARLEAEWGSAEVAWGVLNRHQRPLPGAPPGLDPDRSHLAVGGAPGNLGSIFTYNATPFGSAAPRWGRSGNSFVKVVAFGPTVRAASILNYGQSGDPDSPHFFDQAELYARRQFKPAWFSRAEVVANAVRSYEVR
ncbi:MAG: penicillin acylase family protein [Gemmatimonadota bacterium]